MDAKIKVALVAEDGRELSIHEQLDLFGLDECVGATLNSDELTAAERKQALRRYQAAAKCLGEISPDEIAFLHAGLCQTGLPHSRPETNWQPWQRSNGRFHLVVEPGTLINTATGKAEHVGVPYGPKARLIFMHINTQGVKSRRVHLGKSMSSWMKRLGLHVSGGEHGSIKPFKAQTLRLGRARFSFQFESENGGIGVSDTQIADKLHLWLTDEDAPWLEEIELTEKFHEHLREHAVPLSDHAVAHLADSCLKLDFYAWAAWRLPRLQRPLRLNWQQLSATFSSADEPKRLAERIRKTVLPEVHAVYRDMKVESVKGGLLLYPSKPPIPRTLVAVKPPAPVLDKPESDPIND